MTLKDRLNIIKQGAIRLGLGALLVCGFSGLGCTRQSETYNLHGKKITIAITDNTEVSMFGVYGKHEDITIDSSGSRVTIIDGVYSGNLSGKIGDSPYDKVIEEKIPGKRWVYSTNRVISPNGNVYGSTPLGADFLKVAIDKLAHYDSIYQSSIAEIESIARNN